MAFVVEMAAISVELDEQPRGNADTKDDLACDREGHELAVAAASTLDGKIVF